MHNYQNHDVEACLKYRKIVFVGDSTVRQVFWATARKLDPGRAEREMQAAERHTDIIFGGASVIVEFYWDPYLNSSSLHKHLTAASFPKADRSEGDGAAIVLVGAGLWHARYLGDSSFHRFNTSISNIVRFMTTQAHHSSNTADNLLVLAPVQVPLYGSLAHSRATLTADKVDPLNEYLFQLATKRDLPVAWAFSLMTWSQATAYDTDGLHLVSDIADRKADVLLNMRCNAILTRIQGYPMDKTCCTGYQQPNWIQYGFVISAIGLFPGVLVVFVKGMTPPL